MVESESESESELVEVVEKQEYLSACVRPSSIFPKPKNTDIKEDTNLRAERVLLYQQRLDNNQDIWTGNPLPFDVSKLK